MGTNYYHRTNTCASCGRYDETHIGKLSGGWGFHFYAPTFDDDEGYTRIRSYTQWMERLESCGKIYSGYGEEITLQNFVTLVMNSRGLTNQADYAAQNETCISIRPHVWKDEDGWAFCDLKFS